MTTNPSVIRRTYDAVALFALLNVLMFGGLVAFVVTTGAVDGEKLRGIVAVLRGEEKTEAVAPATEEGADEETEPKKPGTGADALAELQMNLEIMRREGDRIKTELDQRLALNNSIMLRVTTEREKFADEREENAKQQDLARGERRDEGFKKQIDIYESLSPKVAVRHLLAIAEPDDAAKILLELSTRKAKSIVEAAKRGNQMEKMKTILQRVREVAPQRSEELGTDGP